MTELEEIVREMKIDAQVLPRTVLPEIVKSSPLPSPAVDPQTIGEINAILSHYGFSTLKEGDSLSAQLEVLVALEQAGISTGVDCTSLLAKLERVEEYKQIEMACDRYEIELANQEAGGHLKYKGMTIDGLQALAAQRREEFELISGLGSPDVARLHGMLETRDLARLADSLGYMCDQTAGIAAYMRAADLLQARQDDWCRALLLVISGVTSVDELGGALRTDRVGVLRVIYQLCSKGILDYDRLADTVRLLTDG